MIFLRVMKELTIGIVIIAISILGYISNWLNWRFLNYRINRYLYYFGAFVHESSHAILCVATGAKISKYRVISSQPQVIYSNPRLPIIGNLLISIAPVLGGLTFLFFVNKYFLTNQFVMPHFSNLKFFMDDLLKFIAQINITRWKDLILLFLLLNMGAMIGPSWQDLKNVWILIAILVFIPWPFFVHLGLLATAFIIMGIIFQVILMAVIYLFSFLI